MKLHTDYPGQNDTRLDDEGNIYVRGIPLRNQPAPVVLFMGFVEADCGSRQVERCSWRMRRRNWNQPK